MTERRKQRLIALLEQVRDEDLLAVELFLELIAEPQPGLDAEDAVAIERLLDKSAGNPG